MADSRFIDPGPASDEAVRLATRLGMSLTVADVLFRRGVQPGSATDAWLRPKLAQLTQPSAMADRQAATKRIARAITDREPIVVFGDYDCDGITSTAILTEAIRVLGGQASPVLASRFKGGYGFSSEALERVLELSPKLLVTCDCGSSDHDRLEVARERGLDVVVIDHHLVPDRPLPVQAFLNPHRPECGFPYKGLASCGLALSVVAALRAELGVKLDVRQWLDLVAIGTVADVAPLDGDNRVLVHKGLEIIDQGKRLGLAQIVRKANRGRSVPMSSEDIAFQIAPRLNAPGRLGDPDLALELLIESDPVKAAEIAERIETMTLERRALQKTMIEQAVEDIAAGGYAEQSAIMLARPQWHHGIVGIVAGRIADQFSKPVVVAAIDEGVARGSVRGPDGFRLHDALTQTAEHLSKFGGHQAAAGLELPEAGIEVFRAAWNEACRAQTEASPEVVEKPLAEVRLDPRDDIPAVLSDLERLEPCGEKNPAPRLYMGQVLVTDTRVVGEDHLKLTIQLGRVQLSAFAPRMADQVEAVIGRKTVLVGRLKRDHWRGGRSAEVLVEAMSPLE